MREKKKKQKTQTKPKYKKYVKPCGWCRIFFHLGKILLSTTALPLKNTFADIISAFIKTVFWNDGTMLTDLFRTIFWLILLIPAVILNRLSCYQAGMQQKITLEELRIRRGDINIAFWNKADYSSSKCHSQVTNYEGRKTVSETVWRVCQKARCCYWKTTSHKLALVSYRAGTQWWYLLC